MHAGHFGPSGRRPLFAEHGGHFSLGRLELLSGTQPIWASAHTELLASRQTEVDLERVRELNFGKKKQKSEGSSKAGGWEAGVGYGHTGTEGGATWDVAATEKAQAQVCSLP